MNKHTPGPWRVMDRPENAIWVQGQPDENGYREICTLPNYQLLKREQTEANARLIAAAPELLEALKGCAAMLAECAKQHRLDGSGEGHGTLADKHAAIARAAIDKATGE